MNDSEGLQRHIRSCDAMRRLTIWSMFALAAFNFVVILFVTAQTFMIKGRQDRMLAWIETADHIRATDVNDLADRIAKSDERFEAIEASMLEIKNLIIKVIDHNKMKDGTDGAGSITPRR